VRTSNRSSMWVPFIPPLTQKSSSYSYIVQVCLILWLGKKGGVLNRLHVTLLLKVSSWIQCVLRVFPRNYPDELKGKQWEKPKTAKALFILACHYFPVTMV
jgi:hypothetical protein